MDRGTPGLFIGSHFERATSPEREGGISPRPISFEADIFPPPAPSSSERAMPHPRVGCSHSNLNYSVHNDDMKTLHCD